MLKRIMVPTDGSLESERAVPFAETLAKANDAEVLFVQSVDLPLLLSEEYEGGTDWAQTLDLFTATAQANLDRLTSRFERDEVKTTAIRLVGNPAGALLDLEKEQQPDAVVMATHGRTGFARFALGSVADRMVRHGVAPVLLVRDEIPGAKLDAALVMLDGSGLAEEGLKAVKRLAGHPLEKVKLFRAVADPADRKAAMSYLVGVDARLAKHDLDIDAVVDIGEPSALLDSVAEDTDFIILTTHGRGGLDRFRHGSVADRIVRQSKKPVLLMRAGILPEDAGV